MTNRIKYSFLLLTFLVTAIVSCDKERKEEVKLVPKKILYVVKGTQLKLNFIDSQSVFQREMVFTDSFHYEFMKGPGAQIGITVNPGSSTDTIYSWHLFINGKLYANAFSQGGVYLTVPYD